MEEYYVIYWSETGNTKEMAEAVGEGIRSTGKTANVVEVGNISADVLKEASAFALGCPATGAEELEAEEMNPFVEQVETFATGKNIALFGSYGWGDGQWMRDWENRMTKAGATIVGGAGVICNETPDADALNDCRELGKKLVQS